MRVQVVPYDQAWSQLYKAESGRIERALGRVVANIHHVGSTAVPGLAAKPIIDILLSVLSLNELDSSTRKLEKIGYEALGEFGIPSRRYFRKDDMSGMRTHQIHAFAAGSHDLLRHIAFRDYLMAHPKVAAEYGRLKSDLANQYPSDIDRYISGKDSFVKEHEAKALKWCK